MSEGDEATVRMLERSDDDVTSTAQSLLSDAENYDLVVVSGGDGTVAPMLYALRERGVAACVFPSGTANLFCANLGNAPEPAALARACRQHTTSALDLGELSWTNDNSENHTCGFAVMAGIGYDAQLMRAALPNKELFGEAAYFLAGITAQRPVSQLFTIEVDGVVYEREGVACLVANNAMIQADIQMVPNCRMDDGLLDVILLETADAPAIVGSLALGLMKRRAPRPVIETFRGATVRIQASRAIPLEVDGEVHPGLVTSYTARALPRCVNVVVDQVSPYNHNARPR